MGKLDKTYENAKELKNQGYGKGYIIAKNKTIDNKQFMLLQTAKHKKVFVLFESDYVYFGKGVKRGDLVSLNTETELEYVWEKFVEQKTIKKSIEGGECMSTVRLTKAQKKKNAGVSKTKAKCSTKQNKANVANPEEE